MKNMTKQQIWKRVLNRMCCSENPITGNRPCDNGVLCDMCQAELVQEVYQEELKRYGLTED